MTDKYAVIVPVYNSQDSLKELFDRLKATFAALQKDYKVIFVDDNSRDKSWEVIGQLKNENPSTIVAIRLSKNFGQHNAIFCGLAFIEDRNVVTIDDDLQIPPEEIATLINRQKETDADVVYGIFNGKKHAAWRNLGSYLMGKIFQYFASTPGKGSSFKLIANEIAHHVNSTNQSLAYLDEALGWFTDKVEFATVKHIARRDGRSGYSFIKLLFLTLNLIITYTSLPLKMITYFGLLSSVICLAFVSYFIYMKYTFGAELGFTALITAIFLSTGLILLSLGIIGEYVRRVYATQYKKPPYSIRTILK